MSFSFGHGQIIQDGSQYRASDAVSPASLVTYLRAHSDPDAAVPTPSGLLHVWSISGLLCGYVITPDGFELFNRHTYINTVSADSMAADIAAQSSATDQDQGLMLHSTDNGRHPSMISLAQYAALHGKSLETIRVRIFRGLHPEAFKVGRNWQIPSDAPYLDNRLKK